MFGIMRPRTLLSLSLLSPPLLSLLSLSLLPLPCTALRIIVTPTTSTNAPTTVYWIREPSDPQPLFDLRFVVQQDNAGSADGNGEADVGLAAANIPISVGSGDGTTRMGKEEVSFPKSGQYVLKAVAGPTFQVIGTSNEVVVSPPGTITLSTSPTSTSASTSTSGKATGTNDAGPNGSSVNQPKSKTPLIVGATLGSLLFLALTALLLWFLVRRRRLARERDRLSFRPEDMIQRRRSRPQWVSRLSLRVQARDGGDGNGIASAPVGGSFPTENPFATPASTPPGREREVSFTQPLTPSAANVLASVPPSRRELIAREMRESSTSVSAYSQESLRDVEAQPPTPPPKERRGERRSGAWTLVEQALANVRRRASMVSRSSSVAGSSERGGAPVPPVSASPFVSTFSAPRPPSSLTAPPPPPPALGLSASTTTSTGTSTTHASEASTTPPRPPKNMAERAGKRISILPLLPPQPVNAGGDVRGLPPVPLGPAFDAVSVLSASGSEGEGGGVKRNDTVSTISSMETLSDKARGKQRSDSILRPALASPTKLETIPASPATTVSGSVGHGSVLPSSSTPPPVPSTVTPPTPTLPSDNAMKERDEKRKETERRPLPTPTPVPVIHAPVPSVPIVPPSPIIARSRPLPSPLVLKSASFNASFPVVAAPPPLRSATNVSRAATVAHAPSSATLRALPPLPPTPATGAFPRSATFPSSAVPYTPSFPIPSVPSYDLPTTPMSAAFTSAHPAPLTPGLRESFERSRSSGDDKKGEGDGKAEGKEEEGGSVQRTPSYTRDTVPPVLRTYTKRQRHIEHRIGQVKVQLRLLKRKIDASQVDADVGRRVVQDLNKQLAWLEVHLYGDWALEEEGAQRPEEWGRYMRP